MTRSRRGLSAFLWCALLMISAVPFANATTFKRQATIVDLLNHSELIIHGRVINLTDGIDQRGIPYTEVTIRVLETIKGQRQLVWEYRKLMDNILWLASDYLIWYTAAHIALVSQDARQRLADVLVTLSTSLGHVTEKGTELEITNEELANTANVTLFTASRLLSEWHRSGAIKKTRRKILLRAPKHLV